MYGRIRNYWSWRWCYWCCAHGVLGHRSRSNGFIHWSLSVSFFKLSKTSWNKFMPHDGPHRDRLSRLTPKLLKTQKRHWGASQKTQPCTHETRYKTTRNGTGASHEAPPCNKQPQNNRHWRLPGDPAVPRSKMDKINQQSFGNMLMSFDSTTWRKKNDVNVTLHDVVRRSVGTPLSTLPMTLGRKNILATQTSAPTGMLFASESMWVCFLSEFSAVNLSTVS